MASVVFLPHAPSSVAVARQRLCAELWSRGVLESAVSDATLVISELLSNALHHAHPLPAGQLQMSWQWYEDRIEVAISDGGAFTEPRRRRSTTLSSLGGRGLGIVEYIADRWGVIQEDSGTTVWALLAAPEVTETRTPDHAVPRTETTGDGEAGAATCLGRPDPARAGLP